MLGGDSASSSLSPPTAGGGGEIAGSDGSDRSKAGGSGDDERDERDERGERDERDERGPAGTPPGVGGRARGVEPAPACLREGSRGDWFRGGNGVDGASPGGESTTPSRLIGLAGGGGDAGSDSGGSGGVTGSGDRAGGNFRGVGCRRGCGCGDLDTGPPIASRCRPPAVNTRPEVGIRGGGGWSRSLALRSSGRLLLLKRSCRAAVGYQPDAPGSPN